MEERKSVRNHVLYLYIYISIYLYTSISYREGGISCEIGGYGGEEVGQEPCPQVAAADLA
jgi:hypothetical protein